MDSKLKWIRLPYSKLFTLNQLLGIFMCLVVWIYYQWTWNCQSDVADSRNQTQTPLVRNQQNVSWIPNNHPAGTFATVKLLIPDILPESVEKVISLDCDMLFNDDIRNLWDHFSHFKHDQIIGAATEQSPESPYKSRNLTSGVNAGVLLLHLRRMRQSDWHSLWKRALSVLLADTGMLIDGEQGIISEVVRINPSLYYLLPCQWNVQLWRLDGSKYCPVYWLDRLAKMQLYRERKLAKAESKLPSLVHCNKHQKPTLLGQEPIRNSNLSSTEEFLDNQQLVRRFKESFHWFRKLDRACLE
ncbi:unnamed protein product [Calicophoron daubneyi]|uniref:Glycosyltransferase n=1 Tax=Calicophoron daubneyi TaxID=300641 RepID=A0AAV2SVT1_CALDB